ncbi:transposase [Streptomyces sp. NPDC050548]|uniref:transposase n=1 Tax=Streptomyces sp. NPDC050548 TaxID=3365629 RepID=UPI0037B08E6B
MSAHARPGADPTLVMNVVEAVRSLLVELDSSRAETRPDPAEHPDPPSGDLTDDEWRAVEPLPPLGERGPYPEALRRQFDGVMWRFRTGSPWRNMPSRYGAWQTVHHRFRQRALAGTFQVLTAAATESIAREPAALERAADEERRLRDRVATHP